MDIKTKFKPGQTIYSTDDFGLIVGVIKSIEIKINHGLEIEIRYQVNELRNKVMEWNAYASFEDLVSGLSEQRTTRIIE